MRFQGKAILAAVFLWSGLAARSQDVAHTATPTVIRTETRVVLVDTVVTDKKGNYLTDLPQKNFKVFEDGKEQPITSFSYEADPNGPNNNQKRYMVLFFDNASVSMGDQMKAREAAQKFVDTNAGPNRLIAVVNFSGAMRIAQNFTSDAQRLKEVISGAKSSAVSTDDGTVSNGGGSLPKLSASSSFGVSSVLMGMRNLAKGLADLPGRKVLVMLTAGFVLPEDQRAELTATIAACNKYNVSIYPVDVRGLTGGGMPASSPGFPGGRGGRGNDPVPQARVSLPGGSSSSGLLRWASFSNSFVAPDQARGGTGGTAGGTTGGTGGGAAPGAGAGAGAGASGGSRGGTAAPSAPTSSPGGTAGRGAPGATVPGGINRSPNGVNNGLNGRGGIVNPNMNPNAARELNATRNILLPPGMDMNRDVLYALAEGTGGFVVNNTNDLLGGMEKIAREGNQYYVLGFTPVSSNEGSCHSLKVKVDKGGTSVRARNAYCNVHQVDVLAGKPVETELESLAIGVSKGNLGSPLQMPFFFSGPNVARVNVAMEIPSQTFKFEKVKGKFHSEMNLLGIANRPDGSVAAKFSDALKYDFDNKTQVEEFAKKPVHYETQFDIASGQYNVKVVFSAGAENFGKIEKPLSIETFDGKQFAVSSLALGKVLQSNAEDTGLDAALIEDRVPLLAKGLQVIPAADYHFKPTDAPHVYFEIFEQGETEENPPKVLFSLQVVDKASGQAKMTAQNQDLSGYVRKGNPIVPVILVLPIKDLAPGSYKLDILGLNSAGKGILRSADFEVEPAIGPVSGWDKK